MRRSRLLWRIYFYFLLATAATLAIAATYAVRSLRRFHEDQVSESLQASARLVAWEVARLPIDPATDSLDGQCKAMGPLVGARITVILPDGVVVGDSDEDPGRMGNHANRPEVAAAFDGATGKSSRFSDTMKRTLKYVAIPVRTNGNVSAVVRLSRPLAEIRWSQRVLSRQILLGALSAVLLFAVVALYLSRRITRPLEEMRRVAKNLAAGDLNSRMAVTTDDEVGDLARALNETASQLRARMETISRQQEEQRAVLTCMVEGVLAVDPDGRILYINDAAARLLDVVADRAHGHSVQEVVRHHGLQEFIAATMNDTNTSETALAMRGVEERFVHVHGAQLKGPAGAHIGALVVMNDITRMKRLERVRSDFVANVSHELKTPITALKGCVETLSGDSTPTPDDAARFMDMMGRHVRRLEAVVEDLLSLSRLEFDVEGAGHVNRETGVLSDILERVVQTHASNAESSGISLAVACSGDLRAPVNPPLLEQAVGNLVDNAIKYSGHGTEVRIVVSRENGRIAIRVADQGPGIEKKHLPRLFERFYRVDRARSRALGGTGLGLSIVKHIALAHGGNVTVESVVGQGSIFTIHLPASA